MARVAQAEPARSVQANDSHEDRPIIESSRITCCHGIGRRETHDWNNSEPGYVFRRLDLDAKAGDADIGPVGRYQQADATNPKVLQNLGAETNFPPLFCPRIFRRIF